MCGYRLPNWEPELNRLQVERAAKIGIRSQRGSSHEITGRWSPSDNHVGVASQTESLWRLQKNVM